MTNVYPVGAAWTVTANNGRTIARIWLDARNELQGRPGRFQEVWKWTASYDDGSGYKSDWGPSRRAVQEEANGVIRYYGYRGFKFKRDKASVLTQEGKRANA